MNVGVRVTESLYNQISVLTIYRAEIVNSWTGLHSGTDVPAIHQHDCCCYLQLADRATLYKYSVQMISTKHLHLLSHSPTALIKTTENAAKR